MFTVGSVRHAWPERAGFFINRPKGHEQYTFLHFFNSVELLVNGEMLVTEPGACVLFAPGVPQWFFSKEPLCHDWMHFSCDELPAGMDPQTVYYPADTACVTAIVQEIECEFATAKTHRTRMMELKIEELLIKTGRAAAGETLPPVGLTTALRLRELRRQMLLHLSEPWTVEIMAKKVHLSPSRLYVVYRVTYGKSPMDDLISARIEAAKNLLVFTDDAIAGIAERLGYSNVSHFHRQFKNVVGITPCVYRKQKRKT